MSNRVDIEDIFNEAFQDFKTTPSDNVWGNLETSLNNSFPETTYANKFSDFTYQASDSVWSAISSKLWLDSFLRFSLGNFNIYYAASIVASLFLAFSLLDFNKDKTNNIVSNDITTIKTVDKSNVNNNSNSNNKDIKNNNALTTNSINEINPVIDDSTSVSNNNDVKETLVVPTNNTSKINSSEDYYQEPIDVETKTVIKYVNKYITDTVTIFKTDTVILRDTVFKEVTKDPLAVVKSPWSVDLIYTPMFSNTTLGGPNNIVNKINDNTSPAYNWSIGLNLNYKINNFSIQSGIAYTNFAEKFSYSEETMEINKHQETRYDVVGEYTYIDKYSEWIITGMDIVPILDTVSSSYEIHEYEYNGVAIIDTVWTYQTDTVMVQTYDSMEIVHYDTITALKYDSVDVVIIDTLKTRSFYEFVNRYTYMEIPLILNYELKHNKLSYVFGGGLITGVFLNAKGKGISLDDEVVSLEDLPFMKLNLSGIVNAGVHYHFNPKMSILFEAVYRRNFNSIYNNSYFLEQRFNSFGLKLGMRYRF